MRALEMQAEKAGHPFSLGVNARFSGSQCDIRPVGDERDHQRRGAEFRMGGADPGYSFRIRLVIEHHPTAAVDLKVNEARRDQQSWRVDDLGFCRCGHAATDVADTAIHGHEHPVVVPCGTIENAGADKCLDAAH